VLTDITHVLTDITHVLTDITHVLTDITHVLTDITHVLTDITHVLTDITHVLTDITHVLTDITSTPPPCTRLAALCFALPDMSRALNEAQLKQVIKGVGGLRHEDWRSFMNERTPGAEPQHPHLQHLNSKPPRLRDPAGKHKCHASE
jgi:hypothetical protein